MTDEESSDYNKMQCHLVIILPDGIYEPDIHYRLFWYRHAAEKFVAQWVLLNPCDQCRIEKLVIN
jgi:hypothetical protein